MPTGPGDVLELIRHGPARAQPRHRRLGRHHPHTGALTDLDANLLADRDVEVASRAVRRARSTPERGRQVSTGIGTGIVMDGRPYWGADGGAGDIGHVRLRSHGDALCMCGAHGCLAAVASGRAVARALTDLGIPAESGRDVRALLAAWSPEAARLTQEAGRLVGEVMATVVSVLDPQVVAVDGALASAPLIAGIRCNMVHRRVPHTLTRDLDAPRGALRTVPAAR